MKKQSIIDRLDKKIQTGPGCWEWIAGKDRAQYGRVLIEGKNKLAHRIVYELVVGPIPEGLQLDHLCRNRGCVNPHHLEPVTQYVNLMRGYGVGAINSRKTHCPKGHCFTETGKYTTGRCRPCALRAHIKEHDIED